MKANNILETIGRTPHVRMGKLFPNAEVWIKSERTNPGGSIKDRIALAMIEAAGLGVAYRAKPVVAARAAARIDHADLTALLYFQGYRAEDFSAD